MSEIYFFLSLSLFHTFQVNHSWRNHSLSQHLLCIRLILLYGMLSAHQWNIDIRFETFLHGLHIHPVSSLIVTGTFFWNVFLGGLNFKNLRDINKVWTSALDKIRFCFPFRLGEMEMRALFIFNRLESDYFYVYSSYHLFRKWFDPHTGNCIDMAC